MKQSALTPLENRERFIVTQSNSLVEANYSPDLAARAHKTAKLILSLIQPDDGDLRTYTIQIDALKQYLGLAANARWGDFYNRIKETAEKLNASPIEIKEADGSTLVAYFLSSYKLNPKKRGTITFEISGLLKPYLLELKKNYTSYLLIHIPKLRSVYSIRLYELLYQYRKIGKRQFDLEDLQKKAGSNYKLYGNFKKKVLLQAQKDLKKHTDLSFVFNEKKSGRKVTSIEFMIFGNRPKSENPDQLSFLENAIEMDSKQEKPAFSETIVKTMNKLGISEQNIVKYLAMGFEIINGEKKEREAVISRIQTLENYYLEKLELTKHSANRENAAGFFIKALKEDWTNSKALQKNKTTSAIKKHKAAESKLKKMTAKIDRLLQQKKDLQAPIIAELIADDAILKTAYNAVINKMNDFIKRSVSKLLHLPIREQYEQSMSISSSIRVYLFEHYPKRFKEANAIDQEIKQVQNDIQVLKKESPTIK